MRWAIALLLACATVLAQVAIPALSKRVTDTTMTLDAAAIARIEAPLAALEAQKGAQIAVLLVPSTGEESIEAYALRAFDQWKLGRAGVDDGILLVLAMQDRTVRIEVGYGLEGAVPDIVAHRVIQEYLVPKLREGDPAGGIEAAVGALVKLVQGEALPAPMSDHPTSSGGGELAPSLMMFGVLAFFLNNFVGWLPRMVRSPLLGVGLGVVARVFFGAEWTTVALAVVIGLVVGLIRIVPGRVARGSGYGGMGGGSSRSGGFGGGGFGGGGGWSGGGGRSGGGGASGRW